MRPRPPSGWPGRSSQAAAIATALAGFPLHEARVGRRCWRPRCSRRRRRSSHCAGACSRSSPALWSRSPCSWSSANLAFDGGTILAVVPPLVRRARRALSGARRVRRRRAAPARTRCSTALTRGGAATAARAGCARRCCSARRFGMVSRARPAGAELLQPVWSSRPSTQRFDVRGSRRPAQGHRRWSRSTTRRSPSRRSREWPFDRTRPREGHPPPAQGGAKVIAYDVQFTEASGDHEGATRRWSTPSQDAAGNVVMATTEVGEHGEATVLLRRRRRARYSRGRRRRSRTPARPRRRGSGACTSRSQNLRSLRDGGGAARSRRGRARHRGLERAGSTSPGPPDRSSTSASSTSSRGTFNPADVKGKVVVVGATAPSLQDLHPTSTDQGGLMPGPEIHAQRDPDRARRLPAAQRPAWLELAAGHRCSALITPLVGLRAAAIVPSRDRVGVRGDRRVPRRRPAGLRHAARSCPSSTRSSPGIAALLATGLDPRPDRRRSSASRRATRSRASCPEAVVDQVLADADGVRLGGVRGEATVMFSDLRGFTLVQRDARAGARDRVAQPAT